MSNPTECAASPGRFRSDLNRRILNRGERRLMNEDELVRVQIRPEEIFQRR